MGIREDFGPVKDALTKVYMVQVESIFFVCLAKAIEINDGMMYFYVCHYLFCLWKVKYDRNHI